MPTIQASNCVHQTIREVYFQMLIEKSSNASLTVESLLRPVPIVINTTSCNGVLDLFHKDDKLYAIPVVNDKVRPVGMIVRQVVTDVFSKQFHKELIGDKPVSDMMDHNPIVVDINTSIEDVGRIILDAGIQYMLSGFIITKDSRCVGMANGYDLLNEIMKHREKHLFGLAHFDQLTGLPNRTLLMDRLSQAISIATRTHGKISLLFIDLDGFKPVNDTFGHDIGDGVLKEVAARLLSCIREGDTSARLGGDEFVVTLLDSGLERATILADRILEKLRLPYEIGQRVINSISASIGIAEFPLHADNLDDLLIAADMAMYVAKKSGKNQFSVFDSQKQSPE